MYYEDFSVGDRFVTRPVTFSEEAIVAFANRYDPQSFHVDHEAAKTSHYGGLIASGWHTLAATFREAVRLGLFDEGGQGAPGLDDVRWLEPVRPDDSLHMTILVEEKIASTTRPKRGYVRLRFEIMNQSDALVAHYSVRELFSRRPEEPNAPRSGGAINAADDSNRANC